MALTWPFDTRCFNELLERRPDCCLLLAFTWLHKFDRMFVTFPKHIRDSHLNTHDAFCPVFAFHQSDQLLNKHEDVQRSSARSLFFRPAIAFNCVPFLVTVQDSSIFFRFYAHNFARFIGLERRYNNKYNYYNNI